MVRSQPSSGEQELEGEKNLKWPETCFCTLQNPSRSSRTLKEWARPVHCVWVMHMRLGSGPCPLMRSKWQQSLVNHQALPKFVNYQCGVICLYVCLYEHYMSLHNSLKWCSTDTGLLFQWELGHHRNPFPSEHYSSMAPLKWMQHFLYAPYFGINVNHARLLYTGSVSK